MDKDEINNKNHSLKTRLVTMGLLSINIMKRTRSQPWEYPSVFLLHWVNRILIALFLGEDLLILSNMLFSITVVSAGYHVIIEGFGDTIKR